MVLCVYISCSAQSISVLNQWVNYDKNKNCAGTIPESGIVFCKGDAFVFRNAFCHIMLSIFSTLRSDYTKRKSGSTWVASSMQLAIWCALSSSQSPKPWPFCLHWRSGAEVRPAHVLRVQYLTRRDCRCYQSYQSGLIFTLSIMYDPHQCKCRHTYETRQASLKDGD